GRSLPQNHRQRSFPNGSLVVVDVQRSADSGWYACVASDPQGNTARGQLAVHVMTPPVVNPFNFADDLTEGKRAGAACIVSDGDLPISIQWLKDGLPLDRRGLGASIAEANDYTSFLSFTGVRQLHSGNYTCVASNPAASANYTAPMVVQGTQGGRDFTVIISNANVQILENGSLCIREADRSDAGHYMCQALNGVGPGISTVVKLDVHEPRSSRICDVSRCIQTAEHRYIVEEKPGKEVLEYVVRIPSVDRRDSSLFSCYAENAYGRDDTNFQVVVQ
ncbi:hypothetical protein V5799_013331, partial [Amblyomma americanum]